MKLKEILKAVGVCLPLAFIAVANVQPIIGLHANEEEVPNYLPPQA